MHRCIKDEYGKSNTIHSVQRGKGYDIMLTAPLFLELTHKTSLFHPPEQTCLRTIFFT